MRAAALLVLPVAFFIFGLAAGMFVNQLQQSREEFALSTPTAEGLLPADRISSDAIKVYANHVDIEIPNAQWASFSPTGSMLPVLGPTAHALQIVPQSGDDIKVGDIISYHYNGKVISHRVIEKGADDQGTYFIAKGDNNPEPDPEPVRFSQIDRVVVAIVY